MQHDDTIKSSRRCDSNNYYTLDGTRFHDKKKGDVNERSEFISLSLVRVIIPAIVRAQNEGDSPRTNVLREIEKNVVMMIASQNSARSNNVIYLRNFIRFMHASVCKYIFVCVERRKIQYTVFICHASNTQPSVFMIYPYSSTLISRPS